MRELVWNVVSLSHLIPRTNQCELKVRKDYQLQSFANQLPDAFINIKTAAKSHIPGVNVPRKIDISNENVENILTNESKIHKKRGQPARVQG